MHLALTRFGSWELGRALDTSKSVLATQVNRRDTRTKHNDDRVQAR